MHSGVQGLTGASTEPDCVLCLTYAEDTYPCCHSGKLQGDLSHGSASFPPKFVRCE